MTHIIRRKTVVIWISCSYKGPVSLHASIQNMPQEKGSEKYIICFNKGLPTFQCLARKLFSTEGKEELVG